MSHGVTCQFNFPASAVRAIDPHPADCQCADCFALRARTTLTPDYSTHPTVSDGEQPMGSADSSVSRTGCSKISLAQRGTIIDHARQVIIKQIKELIGDDVQCWRLHKKYLDRLNFARLCARRDQLRSERLPMQRDLFTAENAKDTKA